VAEPKDDSISDRMRQADAEDPLTWWNAPTYAEAWRRLLDLFELVPALSLCQPDHALAIMRV
jgi:hypothetical protein